eukprot:TRINITY_DN411_c0_g1_i1.p1 TRINITY_DN411_c0_g1~~TRINITY_DN411_c0_g1_i1.p1  ORF type:complete len:248 (-),score=23.56 TRINITY_DN411_c0_g1_i1:418-1161(-)
MISKLFVFGLLVSAAFSQSSTTAAVSSQTGSDAKQQQQRKSVDDCIADRCPGLTGVTLDECRMKCNIICGPAANLADGNLEQVRNNYCRKTKLLNATKFGIQVAWSSSWSPASLGYQLENNGLKGEAVPLNYLLGAWIAHQEDPDKWFEFRSETIREWVAIVTKGRGSNDSWPGPQWVKSYQVRWSNTGEEGDWYDVDKGKVFNANTDNNTPVRNNFENTVHARILRIAIKQCNIYCSMRVDALFRL